MKFITEDELRTKYRQMPFSKYRLEDDCRLTPGAKQFLIDFRIEYSKCDDFKLNKESIINMFDKKAELQKNEFSKCLAVKLKKIARKLFKHDEIIAEKLNGLAVALYQGVSFEEMHDEVDDNISMDNIIFLDLIDNKLEVALDILEFDKELLNRIHSLNRGSKSSNDLEKKKQIENHLNTVITLRSKLNIALHDFFEIEEVEDARPKIH